MRLQLYHKKMTLGKNKLVIHSLLSASPSKLLEGRVGATISALSLGSQQSNSDYRMCGKQVRQWAAQKLPFLILTSSWMRRPH